MGTRPNPFREHGDPDTPRRPLLGVGRWRGATSAPRATSAGLGPNKRGQHDGRLGSFWSLQSWRGVLLHPARGHLHEEVTTMGQQGWS